MYKIGQEEIEEIKKVIESSQIFRYGIDNSRRCDTGTHVGSPPPIWIRLWKSLTAVI